MISPWYRGRVETLDAHITLLTVSVATWSGAMISPWYRGRVETPRCSYYSVSVATWSGAMISSWYRGRVETLMLRPCDYI